MELMQDGFVPTYPSIMPREIGNGRLEKKQTNRATPEKRKKQAGWGAILVVVVVRMWRDGGR